jgi:hypothetical protein
MLILPNRHIYKRYELHFTIKRASAETQHNYVTSLQRNLYILKEGHTINVEL